MGWKPRCSLRAEAGGGGEEEPTDGEGRTGNTAGAEEEEGDDASSDSADRVTMPADRSSTSTGLAIWSASLWLPSDCCGSEESLPLGGPSCCGRRSWGREGGDCEGARGREFRTAPEPVWDGDDDDDDDKEEEEEAALAAFGGGARGE